MSTLQKLFLVMALSYLFIKMFLVLMLYIATVRLEKRVLELRRKRKR
ncbi:MAG: hypothetical protein GXY50_09035 [Syntrophomonadaceae bacterium]|nr:hypothetical protein [Syntrophomonadaceae bacterium]